MAKYISRQLEKREKKACGESNDGECLFKLCKLNVIDDDWTIWYRVNNATVKRADGGSDDIFGDEFVVAGWSFQWKTWGG